MIFAVLIMILFIIPVFTGQVVNIGNVTGFLCGFFLYRLTKQPELLKEPLVIITVILLCICILIAVYITYRMIQAVRQKPKGDETLIILGCEIVGEKPSLMQVERLQAALRYLEAYPDTCVICSGGQGRKEKVSEAAAMKKWLCERGIDAKRIYLEDRSVTTEENIEFSKRIIADKELNHRIAVCTNEFHIYRAMRMAENAGLSCTAVSAPTAWWLLPTFYVRELYAILYHGIRSCLHRS